MNYLLPPPQGWAGGCPAPHRPAHPGGRLCEYSASQPPPHVLSSASKQHPSGVHPARWPGSIQHGVGATIPLLHHHLSTLLFSSSIQSRWSDGEARASVWKVGEGSRRARACLIWCNVGCYGGHQPARPHHETAMVTQVCCDRDSHISLLVPPPSPSSPCLWPSHASSWAPTSC